MVRVRGTHPLRTRTLSPVGLGSSPWLYIQSEGLQDIAFHPPVRVPYATHLIFVLGRCGEERAQLPDTMNPGHAVDLRPRSLARSDRSVLWDPGRVTLWRVAPQDSNQNFRDSVALSWRVDPRPTLENLAQNTALTYEDVVHHALVRYASSGAEALFAWESQALRDLIAARKAEDWAKVGAIIDWLEAGLDSPDWY